MNIYANWFARMALIYLALGVVMGVVIGIQPEWSQRLRFVHIHLNLLGFLTMMIAGVAYHVLPRFTARPVPWPGRHSCSFHTAQRRPDRHVGHPPGRGILVRWPVALRVRRLRPDDRSRSVDHGI
ncbi:MAG: hypothetical protein IH886_17225 [Nitrospinae bacterium]|nr:hypothetical protein [Nitrospinota bacterium]